MKSGLHLVLASIFDTFRFTQLLNNWDHKEARLSQCFTQSLDVTRSDSFFSERWKTSAWDVGNVFPQITETFSMLASVPEEIPEQAMALIERFVVLLYSRTSSQTTVNEARQELFS